MKLTTLLAASSPSTDSSSLLLFTALLAALLPLVSCLGIRLFNSNDKTRYPKLAARFIGGSLLSATFASIMIFMNTTEHWALSQHAWQPLTFRLDNLTAIMLPLVSFLGFIVVRYSIRHLQDEPRQARFTTWLSGTVGSVLFLVIAGNFILFGLAWISMSFCLHQLLTFYPHRSGGLWAARQRFLIDRLSDLALLTAAFLTWRSYGTLDFSLLFQTVATNDPSVIAPVNASLIGWLLAGAAILKSAQVPFHSWLPDTMDTPTPVSALMHAGIINAGGFLLIRLSPVLSQHSTLLLSLAIVGAFTAIFGALAALPQNHVKRNLAYSTIAQMGFMVLQCGLGLFALATLHIVAHSLYKAYAFLNSGSLQPSVSQKAMTRPALFSQPEIVTLSICIAGLSTMAVGSLLGVGLLENPGNMLMGYLLALAVAQGQSRFFGTQMLPRTLLRGIFAGLLLTTVYFATHRGAEFILQGVVPTAANATDLGTSAFIGCLVITFTGLFALAMMLPDLAHLPLMRRGFIFFLRGGYLGVPALKVTRWFFPESQWEVQVHGEPPTAAKKEEEHCTQPSPWKYQDSLLVAEAAAKRIPPLWPLENFVAVNPFVGLTDHAFVSSCELMQKVAPGGMQQHPTYYRQQIANGHITENDIKQALERSHEVTHFLPKGFTKRTTPEDVLRFIESPNRPKQAERPYTIAERVDQKHLTQWDEKINHAIAEFCAAYFASEDSEWPMPQRDLGFYRAWREFAASDSELEQHGLTGFCTQAASFPTTIDQAVCDSLTRLQISPHIAETYLHRLLFSLRGWAGHLQYLDREAALRDREERHLMGLLAIKLLCEVALSEKFQTQIPLPTPSTAVDEKKEVSEGTAMLYLLQLAAEISLERKTLLGLGSAAKPMGELEPPKAQAVFCIDVRSEVLRRHLETEAEWLQTKGFAGFFGLPMSYQTIEQQPAHSRCPVLLSPSLHIQETSCHPQQTAKIHKHMELRSAWQQSWQTLKSSASACFSFVESAGLFFGIGLWRKSFPKVDTANEIHSDLGPDLDGIPESSRAQTAFQILNGMGLTEGFAKVVLLVGHGATTTNNPYDSSYQCGACGGHSGDANARLAATLLNDPDVRTRLNAEYCVEIPWTTWFLPALHNTTTDEVSLLNTHKAPNHLRTLLVDLEAALHSASRRTRIERGTKLGLSSSNRDHLQSLVRKSSDWSEIRPEWGLAGNALFVAAPRWRTHAANLEGRAFLHDYDHQNDSDNSVLELIMTAPMVVANWINLQYLASSANPTNFGSGTKVLHQAIGNLGVCSGNGGDIQTGLPLQALHDGEHFIHEPIRLHVLIEAPQEAIDAIIEAQVIVRQLVENQWIHLFSIDDTGSIARRTPNGGWQRCENGTGEMSEELWLDRIHSMID